MMRKLLDSIYKGSCWLGAGCIAAICLLVVCQVTLNLIDRISTVATGSAIGLTIPSYADFTGFLLAAASFLSLAYTLRQGDHIRVTLLLSRLPRTIQHLLEIWSLGFALCVSSYFAWYTISLALESYTYNDLSSGMIAFPLWIPQSAMVVGLVVLSIALLDEFILVLRGNRPSYADEGEGLLVSEKLVQHDSE